MEGGVPSARAGAHEASQGMLCLSLCQGWAAAWTGGWHSEKWTSWHRSRKAPGLLERRMYGMYLSLQVPYPMLQRTVFSGKRLCSFFFFPTTWNPSIPSTNDHWRLPGAKRASPWAGKRAKWKVNDKLRRMMSYMVYIIVILKEQSQARKKNMI